MESTLIRTVSMTVMLVAPKSAVSEEVAIRLERARVRLVRATSVASACERLAVAMPQVVVVIGDVTADEREALGDRTTAVGALVMYVDAQIDRDAMQELVERAARAAIERSLEQEQKSTPSPSGTSDATTSPPTELVTDAPPPSASAAIDVEIEIELDEDDVDSKW